VSFSVESKPIAEPIAESCSLQPLNTLTRKGCCSKDIGEGETGRESVRSLSAESRDEERTDDDTAEDDQVARTTPERHC